MKAVKIFFFLTLLLTTSFAQVDFRAGMGLDLMNSPSLTDYINQSGFSGGSDISSFATAINFSGEVAVKINDDFHLAADLGYQLYSHTTNVILGRYDLAFNNIMPSVLTYYVIEGIGYNFKIGGGGGLRIVSVDETLPASVRSDNYSALGFGLLLRAQGNTLLSHKIYANISLDFRYDANGIPENNGRRLYNYVLKENVNFNQLAIGIKLGFYYKF